MPPLRATERLHAAGVTPPTHTQHAPVLHSLRTSPGAPIQCGARVSGFGTVQADATRVQWVISPKFTS